MNPARRPLWTVIRVFLSGALLLPVVGAAKHIFDGGPLSSGMFAAVAVFASLAFAPWFLPKWLTPALTSETDLEHQPLTVFFKEAVLRTAEGWVWAVTTMAYIGTAALYILYPELAVGGSDIPWGSVIALVGWPILSFIFFVVMCSPYYTSSIFCTALVAMFSLVGFWMVLT